MNYLPEPISSGPARPLGRLPRQTQRTLASVEHQAVVRVAGVHAEGTVASVKVQELQHVARVAASGHTLLRKWADTLASGDPFLVERHWY